MEVSSLSLVLFATTAFLIPVQSAILPSFSDNTYQYSLPVVHAEPVQHLHYAALQDSYSPYVFYNILGMQGALKPLPTTVFSDGKQTVARVPTYNYGYYETPVYDFRFPLHPVYPILQPSHPPLMPRPTQPPTPPTPPIPPIPTTSPTTPPTEEGGIETLDQKVEPETDKKKPTDSGESLENDDTVAVDRM